MDSGKTDRKVEQENSISLMAVTIQETSRMMRPQAQEDCIIPTEITILESGRMIRPTGMDNIPLQVEVSMKAIGKMTSGTARARNLGKMAQSSKEIMNSTRRVEAVNSTSEMAIFLLESSRVASEKVRE